VRLFNDLAYVIQLILDRDQLRQVEYIARLVDSPTVVAVGY
jgi:hypothetical protein